MNTASNTTTGINAQVVQDKLEALGRRYGLDLLGKTTTWTIHKNVRITKSRLRELLDEVGLGYVELPDIREGQILQRALRNLGEAGLVEEVNRKPDRVVYQFTRRLRDRDADLLDYLPTYKLYWFRQDVPDDLQALQISADDPIIVMDANRRRAPEQVERTIRELIAEYREVFCPRDITDKVLGLTIDRYAAIQMRDRGGVYFVPAEGCDVLDRLRLLVKRLAEETSLPCAMYNLSVFDMDTEREDIGLAAMDDLTGQMDLFKLRLEEMDGRGEVVRENTADAKLVELDTLISRVNRYASISEGQMQELLTRAEALRKRALRIRQDAAQRASNKPQKPRRQQRHTATTDADLAALVANEAAADQHTQVRRRRSVATSTEQAPEATASTRRNRRAL